ncbi:carbohydrate binding domain-containing protein [Pimelobacter simplex]|uniref:carbohydrate binding domain-containing protein n=1 Tax=Nocardioides simplex TaxID=2045 RepID=UPI001933D12D|nr:carbohydrate binding domain-containing protein [Pimelobacter simplex]
MQDAEKTTTKTKTNGLVRWLWLPVMAAVLMTAAVAAVPTSAQTGTAAQATVPTGTFESHLDGFAGVGSSSVKLSRAGAGRHHSRALVVRTKDRGPAAAVSKRKFGGAHAKGTRYVVRAWVRSTGQRTVALRVREVKGSTLQTKTKTVDAKGRAWTRVKVTMTAKAKNSVFKLRFRTPSLTSAQRLLVDDLRVNPRGGGKAAAGTLSNGCSRDTRGIPSCGTYIGAAHGGNTDPTALEQDLGNKLAVRRTYYTGTGVASAVKTATTDLAAGRLPWISFKAPYSWTEMADGKGDAWATDLAQRLAALNGPVWIAFHHEPETDGDIQEWRRMQERLAPIIRNNAPNVAYSVIVTGWHQFYGDPQYSLANIWPRGVKVDIAGFDIYQEYGSVKNGKMDLRWVDFGAYFQKIAGWARTVDVEWALGETGITDKAAVDRPTEIANTVKLMQDFGGVAYSYFDSELNSTAPWTLGTPEKRTAFAQVLAGSPHLN